MRNDNMAYELFKFLRKDVTVESLQESTNKAYSTKIEEGSAFKRVVKEDATSAEEKPGKAKFQKMPPKKADEGKLVDDPSKITDPMGTVQTLKEKEAAADNPSIKTNGAGITEKPELTEVQKGMEDICKDTQGKDGKDPDAKAGDPKNKDEKKITPKVSSVKKVAEGSYGGGNVTQVTSVEAAKWLQSAHPGTDSTTTANSLYFDKQSNLFLVDVQDHEYLVSVNDKGRFAFDRSGQRLSPEEANTVFAALGEQIPGFNESKVPTINKPEQSDSKKPLEVSGMEPKKAKNASEGKLVADPSQVNDPAKQIQTLAEEKVLTTVSDENVANDLKTKYPGSRIVPDTDATGKKQFIVMVKEATYKAIMEGKPVVKEATEVTVTTEDGKKVDIIASPEGTTVTTSDSNATALAPSPDVIEPVVPEVAPEEAPAEEPIEEPAEEDEDDRLVAEKMYVADLLKGKTSLTEKEQAFIKAVESIKLSEAKKTRVAEKMKALKDKK